MTYAEAAARLADRQAREAARSRCAPECVTRFHTHGGPTPRVIAFAHGYANCPQMFAALGQAFFARGYNVLSLPLPHHGLADRLTDDLTHLTAEELAAYADEVVDLARGLGAHVTLAGLSAGGVAAAWAAQTREDLDLAVLIAPAFGLKLLPGWLTPLVTWAALRRPDAWIWWNPALRERFTPHYTYPRFSRRGLAQVLRAGLAVSARARRAPPAARAILLITNASDPAVDNAAAARVAADWRAHGAAVTTYEFPAALNLVHNLVDPGETGQRVDLVFPKLLELIAAP